MNLNRHSRESIETHQLVSLNRLVHAIQDSNQFYKNKMKQAGTRGPFATLDQFYQAMPFTTKSELIEDQEANPPYGTNLTEPFERYTRFHQTSGTTTTPLRWLDTAAGWSWIVDNWVRIYREAKVDRRDTVFFAFSFGPFLGFWSAMDAAQKVGCLCIAGGGMSSSARLRAMIDTRVTVLCCTPTYALRLASVAEREGIALKNASVKTIIVAGEPGGSIPAMRKKIESKWNGARVFDHHGMTEVGPVSYESYDHPGVLHVIETSYLAEAIHPETGEPVRESERGELVLTTLGRTASPLIRYRTGDLVQPSWQGVERYGTAELALIGGIIGRIDDMLPIRGVNVYPSLIDELVGSREGIAEYRVLIEEKDNLNEMTIQIEPDAHYNGNEIAQTIEEALRNLLHLRIPVQVVPADSLPRFEMKAKRWVKSKTDE